MAGYEDYEGSGLELVPISDVFDVLGESKILVIDFLTTILKV